MRKLLPILAMLLAAALAPAQSLNEYLKLRSKFGIHQAAGVEALETLVGKRVLEVKGKVKGSFKVADRQSILLERSDGDTLIVDAGNIPDWLTSNEVSARLIIEAYRENEISDLHAKLLGAASESSVAQIEDAEAKKAAAAAKKKSTRAGRTYSQTSRGTSTREDWTLPPDQVTQVYAGYIKSQNRRLSDAQALHIAQCIIGYSIQYGVDARLIMALVMVESSFNPGDTSSAGAQGLGQLMPGTARDLGVTNAYDTQQNLYGTVKLLRSHLDSYRKQTGDDFNSLVLALAAYNAGPGAVARHGGVPPYRETQAYVRKVISLYNAFCGNSR